MDTFNFCPKTMVPQTVPRDPVNGMSLNGWAFAARPAVPFQRKFKVQLHGLRWFLNNTTGLYDSTTSPTLNARALEQFYAAHETWDPFTWVHPHLGSMTVRFDAAVTIPPGKEGSPGVIDPPLEVTFIEHNPGF